jgi:glycosyltransferase involved in cell wall biosynthesis
VSVTPTVHQRVLIALPAYNEAESIEFVLQELRDILPSSHVLVVDDGSSDETAAVAGAFGVDVLRIPFNIGVGGAMRAAFAFGIANKYEVVVQLDSDGQHDPVFIPELVNRLQNADVVVGSRFAGVGDYRIIGPRRWAMRILAFIVSRICGTKLTDVTSGFRATGPRALEIFRHDYPAEYLGDTVESLVIASKSGLTIQEMPVKMRHRFAGRPSQSLPQATLFLFRALLVLILALIRPGSSRAPKEIGKTDGK